MKEEVVQVSPARGKLLSREQLQGCKYHRDLGSIAGGSIAETITGCDMFGREIREDINWMKVVEEAAQPFV